MKSLREYNTFGIEAQAGHICNISSVEELRELVKSGAYARSGPLILGGGSNILLTGNYAGTVYRAGFKESRIAGYSGNEVWIECDAGLEWDTFVEFCVSNNYGGIENLSYIPGSVGASPIQNIGAYGAEICTNIEQVKAVDLESGEMLSFSKSECLFAYRSSIFKYQLKGKVFISSVVFSLTAREHKFNTSYGQVSERLGPGAEINLRNIRDAIISIRKEKLPEPSEIGNAGSFFKNPLLSEEHFSRLQKEYEDLPFFADGKGYIKIPAAWLIEQCKWKGYRQGDAGVHKNQALVLVNYGSATGMEILQLSEQIIDSVYSKFGIMLEREVNVIP